MKEPTLKRQQFIAKQIHLGGFMFVHGSEDHKDAAWMAEKHDLHVTNTKPGEVGRLAFKLWFAGQA